MTVPLHPPTTGAQLLKYTAPGVVAETLARDPRLIIPVGTCEQHGPHLPLGCATIIAEHLCDDLSATYKVLRAPTVEYGVNVESARKALGNSSVRRKTLHRMLNDLLASWEGCGFREFILITAHDHDPHQDALSTVITREARVRVVDLYAIPPGRSASRDSRSTCTAMRPTRRSCSISRPSSCAWNGRRISC